MSTPKTLTSEEANLLLVALQVSDGTPKQVRKGIRNHCLAVVMLDGGLRVSEAIGLEVRDLIFNNTAVTSLIVRPEIAKNHHERQIPISARLSETISKMFMSYWSDHYKNTQHKAFTSGRGDKSLTRRQVYKIISSAAMVAIGRSVNPHVLRHTFASKLMRVTNMRTVQVMLGHSSITSTQIYTHPNGNDLKSAIEKMDHSEVSPVP
ncbi:Tyrosine recombinase XerD [subsurface metagenome]